MKTNQAGGNGTRGRSMATMRKVSHLPATLACIWKEDKFQLDVKRVTKSKAARVDGFVRKREPYTRATDVKGKRAAKTSHVTL